MTAARQPGEPVDHALSARRAISTARRDNKDADPLVTAAVAIANAILAGVDALHELTAAYTGPDGVTDLLSAISTSADGVRTELADLNAHLRRK